MREGAVGRLLQMAEAAGDAAHRADPKEGEVKGKDKEM